MEEVQHEKISEVSKPLLPKTSVLFVVMIAVAVMIGGWFYVDIVRTDLQTQIALLQSSSVQNMSSKKVFQSDRPSSVEIYNNFQYGFKVEGDPECLTVITDNTGHPMSSRVDADFQFKFRKYNGSGYASHGKGFSIVSAEQYENWSSTWTGKIEIIKEYDDGSKLIHFGRRPGEEFKGDPELQACFSSLIATPSL